MGKPQHLAHEDAVRTALRMGNNITIEQAIREFGREEERRLKHLLDSPEQQTSLPTTNAMPDGPVQWLIAAAAAVPAGWFVAYVSAIGKAAGEDSYRGIKRLAERILSHSRNHIEAPPPTNDEPVLVLTPNLPLQAFIQLATIDLSTVAPGTRLLYNTSTGEWTTETKGE